MGRPFDSAQGDSSVEYLGVYKLRAINDRPYIGRVRGIPRQARNDTDGGFEWQTGLFDVERGRPFDPAQGDDFCGEYRLRAINDRPYIGRVRGEAGTKKDRLV